MKRMKWVGLAVVAAALVAEFATSGFHIVNAAPQPRVVICHNTGHGNQTIEVNGNAVSSHISLHGDHVGPCR
jgi:hypothetical protein